MTHQSSPGDPGGSSVPPPPSTSAAGDARPARKPMSTGVIVGIFLGTLGVLALLVTLAMVYALVLAEPSPQSAGGGGGGEPGEPQVEQPVLGEARSIEDVYLTEVPANSGVFRRIGEGWVVTTYEPLVRDYQGEASGEEQRGAVRLFLSSPDDQHFFITELEGSHWVIQEWDEEHDTVILSRPADRADKPATQTVDKVTAGDEYVMIDLVTGDTIDLDLGVRGSARSTYIGHTGAGRSIWAVSDLDPGTVTGLGEVRVYGVGQDGSEPLLGTFPRYVHGGEFRVNPAGTAVLYVALGYAAIMDVETGQVDVIGAHSTLAFDTDPEDPSRGTTYCYFGSWYDNDHVLRVCDEGAGFTGEITTVSAVGVDSSIELISVGASRDVSFEPRGAWLNGEFFLQGSLATDPVGECVGRVFELEDGELKPTAVSRRYEDYDDLYDIVGATDEFLQLYSDSKCAEDPDTAWLVQYYPDTDEAFWIVPPVYDSREFYVDQSLTSYAFAE